MRFGWSPKDTSGRVRGLGKVASLLFVATYTLIYLTEPFAEVWNAILSNMFLIVAASLTATIATMIWSHYERSDSPRRIWGYFAVGLWLWAAAELVWGYFNVTLGEVPEGIADLLWIGGYLFFGQALLIQYRVLARPTWRELASRILTASLFLLALYLLIYSVLVSSAAAQSGSDAAINSFYPAADLLLVLIAMSLARNFSGGAFARPWLGLLAFAFADLLYAWLEFSGLYSWSVNQANPLSAISDVAYLGAYFVLALGMLSHWAFLKYGLLSPTSPR